MALVYHPISVSTAVLSILAVIASPALAQRPPAQGHFLGDRCEGYNGVEGICLAVYTCPTLQQDVNLLSVPEFLKRHGPPCDYDLEGNKLLCCPKNSTEPVINPCGAEGCPEGQLCGVPADGDPFCKAINPCGSEGCPEGQLCGVPADGDPFCIECFNDGVFYQKGQIIEDSCFPHQCDEGTFKPFLNATTGNPCGGPFEIFGENCYHFNPTRVTWCEARKAFVDIGGDLAAGNFNSLKAFFTANNRDWDLWIGVRANLWLNGQQPQQQQWRNGQPSHQDQCGGMRSDGLWDFPCDNTRPSICQLY